MPERGTGEVLFWKALLVAGTLWLIYLSLDLVLLALVALMIAAAILPLADAAQKRRIPRAATVLGVYLVGIGVLSLLVTMLVPVVIEQGNLLAARLPQFRLTLNGWIASAQTFLGRFPGLLAGLLVLFLAAYIVIDRRRLAEGLIRFVPRARRERTAHIGAEVLRRMGGYIRGQTIVSACGALILWLGLTLVGFEAPLLIGVLAGALNFVPYLGSTVSLILALLLALNGSLYTIAGVAAVFGIEQFLEGHFLVPYFPGRQVELHPLAVLA